MKILLLLFIISLSSCFSKEFYKDKRVEAIFVNATLTDVREYPNTEMTYLIWKGSDGLEYGIKLDGLNLGWKKGYTIRSIIRKN